MSQPAKPDNAPITWLALPDPSALDADAIALLEKARANVGFLPNVFAAYTLRPDHMMRWIKLFNAILRGESGLTPAEREMIGVAVSAENRCLYCLVSHGAELRQLTGDPVLAAQISYDYRRAPLDARQRAMLDYAVKLTRTPVECSAADVEHLRALGFSERDIFDIAETTAMFNFTNRLASATGMQPNHEYYAHA
ncbi:MAG: peroxidase-related enzyme [Caldilinea sp.]|mgnify:CR=1 FL=1|uniref:peroxidase-related enzyme n=1 Tax=Caldilinea sp. TaxID=2293560 RepID=UPI002C99C81A|nr:peroxidase-related enzyme [Anaerolineales bacterium]HQY94551.1 peroxidase-related enzyme [Caldilinea sp.]HRA65243.1 peroxidase-related enzyme [Caldilinea sp.]